MIIRVLRVFLSSVFWGRSLYWSTKGDYDRSLQLLDRSIRFRGEADFEMLLRKGYLLGALERECEAMSLLKKSVSKIKFSDKVSSDEKKYLVNYASSLTVIMDRFDVPFFFDDSYDQSNVARHFQDNFPYSK